MPSGTSTGILDKNNSKKKKATPKQQGGTASGNRPTLTAPSTAGLGILGKDPEDVKPPMLREKAQMQGPLGQNNQLPEEALAGIALQRRTAQQNIVPAGGMGAAEEQVSKFQKKRQQKQKPSAVSAV